MTLDTKAARARCDAATPGPWRHVGIGIVERAELPLLHREIADCSGRMGLNDGDSAPTLRDATFIAHARTDLPAALDEVDALRAALAWVDADLARGGYPETSAIRGVIAKALKQGGA